MRPARQTAEGTRQRISAQAKAEQRGNGGSGSDRTSSEEEDGAKIEEPKEPEPEYTISVYIFDNQRKAFGDRKELTLKAEQVKTIFAFREAVSDALHRLKHHMVKVLIAETTNGTTEHELADSDDFSEYFEKAREDPEANKGKELIGIMTGPGDTSDFKKVVDAGNLSFF